MFIQRDRRFSTHVFLLFNDMFIHVQVRTCSYREVEDFCPYLYVYKYVIKQQEDMCRESSPSLYEHVLTCTCNTRTGKDMFMQRGRRLSTHVFILFNDMFIHVQVRTCSYREVEDSLHMSSCCLMTCLCTYR
jgi:hypothetical protein